MGVTKIENMISNLSVMIGLLLAFCELVYAKIMRFFLQKKRKKNYDECVLYLIFAFFLQPTLEL